MADGPVICAEGYLFELERRGYLQAGAFVPEVVLEHPELVAQLHEEFVHAGSDVVEAFTCYAHREKLRLIYREDALETINRQALAIAREVARRRGALLAGAWRMREQTSSDSTAFAGHARCSRCCRRSARKCPLLRCAAGPLPHARRRASFQSLSDAGCDCIPGGRPFPTALDPMTCNRYELGEFARAARELGVGYLGVCCGAGPHHIRAVAEALGRRPLASRYSPDMSRHAFLGSDPSLKQGNLDYAGEL